MNPLFATLLIAATSSVAPMASATEPNTEISREQQKAMSIAVESASIEREEKIFTEVECPAEFPGGQSALMKFISENLRYPSLAAENYIQGRVIVQFVVEKDGSITNIRVARGVDKDLDKEAVRVVQKMPKWVPGKSEGKPVKTIFTLPVTFRLTQ